MCQSSYTSNGFLDPCVHHFLRSLETVVSSEIRVFKTLEFNVKFRTPLESVELLLAVLNHNLSVPGSKFGCSIHESHYDTIVLVSYPSVQTMTSSSFWSKANAFSIW